MRPKAKYSHATRGFILLGGLRPADKAPGLDNLAQSIALYSGMPGEGSPLLFYTPWGPVTPMGMYRGAPRLPQRTGEQTGEQTGK